MFGILWFLFITFSISASMVWVLDNNGSVVINWLGYQVQADILTAILLAILFTILTFIFSYITARLLAIKFPNLLKLFFRKNYLKRLEKVVHRHHRAFKTMSHLLLALETNDQKSAEKLHAEFKKLIKDSSLNNFFSGNLAFKQQQFSKAADFFTKFSDDKNAKILVMKSKLNLALQNQDEVTTIAYAEQILSVKKDDYETAKILLRLYKKRSLWKEAKELIATYGTNENFKDESQKRDIAVINTSLAVEFYQNRKFTKAVKHSNIALKAEKDFLPAIEILLRCSIKRGFIFKTRWMLKSLWRQSPHLVLAEIFDFTNRKFSAKKRLKMMKKFAELNPESALGKLAVANVAFRIGQYETSREFLRLSLLQERTHRAYKLMAFVEKALNNSENFSKNLKKAGMLEHDERYICNSCTKVSSKWSAKCSSCESYDSLEWNS